MKFLKILIGIILILIIAFILIGLLKPSINYGHEIEVNKSAKEAWAVHQDDSKFGEWLDGFKSIEHVGGEYNKIGSTYRVVVEPGDGQGEFVMTEKLKDMEEFKFVDFEFDSDMMMFFQKTSFDEQDGKTKIKTESRVEGKGIMMKSMFAIMDMLTGSFQSQEEKNINALKKVIDENTKDYYPEPKPMDEEMAGEQ
jgi:carbon monoxide dehydrogenase subunit G